MESNEKYPWLANSRTLLIDAYWPPFNPVIEFEAEKLIQKAVELNADTIRFPAIGKYAMIQNSIIPVHPELNGRDVLNEITEAAKGTGIKIIAYAAVGHGLPRSLVVNKKPEWALVMDNGNTQQGISHFGGENVIPVCTFGQYAEDIIKFISRIVNNYNIDGLYLDGPYYNWNMSSLKAVCVCEKCKEMFRKDTGRELPSNRFISQNLSGPGEEITEIFNDWVGGKLYRLLAEIIRIAKKDKGLPVMFNAFSAAGRPEKWERKMLQAADGFLLEAEIGGLNGLGIGTFRNKIIWRYTQPHTPWPRYSTAYPEHKNLKMGIEALLWGGTPIVSYAGRLLCDDSEKKPLRQLFKMMKNTRQTTLDTKKMEFCGILSGSRVMNESKNFKDSLAGAYKLFQAAGIPTGMVPRDALTKYSYIKKYKVIFLNSELKLTQAENEGLEKYVKKGGLIIASGNIFRNVRAPGSAFFGVETLTPESFPELGDYKFWDGPWDIYFKPEDNGKLLPVKDFTFIKAFGDSKIAAHIVKGPGKTKIIPSVVTRKHGKGCSVYINFPVEKLYAEIPDKEYPAFIRNIVSNLANTKIPCAISAEQPVYFSIREGKNKSLLYLLGNNGNKLHSLSLNIPNNMKPEKVKTFITNTKNYRTEGNKIIFEDFEFPDFECIEIFYSKK
jgi:hypothetical protein